MYLHLGEITGDNGRSYGWEWKHDPLDKHIDWLLADTKVSAASIAVDIGCGTGYRAETLGGLGLFNQVVACDINDRTAIIAARQKRLDLSANLSVQSTFPLASTDATKRVPTKLRFLQTGAVDLTPQHFEDTEISFINFRNVGHFLAPVDFRQSLQNIANIAAKDALVAVSFDYLREDGKYHGETALSLSDMIDTNAFYHNDAWLEKSHAPYTKYFASGVKSYMKSLGFRLSTDRIDDEKNLLRCGECRIIAYAPGTACNVSPR